MRRMFGPSDTRSAASSTSSATIPPRARSPPSGRPGPPARPRLGHHDSAEHVCSIDGTIDRHPSDEAAVAARLVGDALEPFELGGGPIASTAPPIGRRRGAPAGRHPVRSPSAPTSRGGRPSASPPRWSGARSARFHVHLTVGGEPQRRPVDDDHRESPPPVTVGDADHFSVVEPHHTSEIVLGHVVERDLPTCVEQLGDTRTWRWGAQSCSGPHRDVR